MSFGETGFTLAFFLLELFAVKKYLGMTLSGKTAQSKRLQLIVFEVSRHCFVASFCPSCVECHQSTSF